MQIMKPVAIFRHAPSEGPGYFATFLDSHGIPWQLFRIDAGEALPADARQFSGLVFMGGPMSVNDDLPWIPHSLELIRQAAQADIPVLGHCLGGQLMAKALGGVVGRNPVKEIGWGEVVVANNATANTWFGEDQKIRCLSLARRDLHDSTRRYLHPGQRALCESGVCHG